jgi:hypothetical protein
MKHLARKLLAATLVVTPAGAAWAQALPPQQQAPNMPGPRDVIPEKMAPEEPSSTGAIGPDSSLSDKLEATDGVIRPPRNVDPEMTTPAPVPNPGTTPVIPPPGSPGGSPQVDPR